MKNIYEGEDQKKFHFLFMLSSKHGDIKNSNKLILTDIDKKLLLMSARPGRVRSFMDADLFLKNWSENIKIFLDHPARIGLIFNDMKIDQNHIATAIELSLSNPIENGKNQWQFDFSVLDKTPYPDHIDNVTLMIDWPAQFPCAPTIKIQVPSLVE